MNRKGVPHPGDTTSVQAGAINNTKTATDSAVQRVGKVIRAVKVRAKPQAARDESAGLPPLGASAEPVKRKGASRWS
ncbi:MAG TPA: hypothetical protein VFF65_04785, partial [Phycisphaerales bacterium]|nr:hypothetical protein [Phycisphaerales bacterium]